MERDRQPGIDKVTITRTIRVTRANSKKDSVRKVRNQRQVTKDILGNTQHIDSVTMPETFTYQPFKSLARSEE